MIDIIVKYTSLNLSCLPCKEDKSPDCKDSWKRDFMPDEFLNAKMIGVKCGLPSNNLECLDFDNHFKDAKDNITKFIEEIKSLYEKYKFPIESTMNGGFHLLYRSEKIEGNLKLAQRPKWDEKLKKFKPDTIIETRGEGGYFVCAPSKGYKFIKNSIENIPTITLDERTEILNICRSFNEWVEIRKNSFEDSEKPGDVFNNNNPIDEVKITLESNGWNEIKSGQWSRPGKDKGISATLGKAANNCFYVFSTNAYPFEPMHGYSPFQVIGLLKYNGDFSQFAKDLAERYNLKKEVKKEIKKKPDELGELLKKCYVDTDCEIDRPPVALFISDNDVTQTIRKRLFTLGNFSCIIGKSKSRKTFLVTMLTSAMLTEKGIYNKFYGNLPGDKRQIVYIDTEQSDYDSAMTVRRVLRLANKNDEFLAAFKFRDLTYSDRCEMIQYIFETYPSIGLMVIDGIADLVKAINDEEEATRISQLLMKWSKQYNCHIITVLHQNKNDNFATGWVGSLLMKKAEIIISVCKEKGSNKDSKVSCDFARGMDFEDFDFNIIDGLPVLVDEFNEKEDIISWVD